jgi:hypothetical protein
LDEKGVPVRADNRFVYTDKTDSELQASADSVMKDILRKSGATHYISFIKGERTVEAKNKIHESYKSNRSKVPPVWWEFVKKDLINRWGAIAADDREVDDYVNVTRLCLPDSFICAIDKDLLGLEGTHYNWKKDLWVSVTRQEAITTFWTDMITGQSGDNIKGLPGKGPKFVEGLWEKAQTTLLPLRLVVFNEYVNHFGEAEGIFEFYRNYTALKVAEHIPLFVLPDLTIVPSSIEQTKDAKTFFSD